MLVFSGLAGACASVTGLSDYPIDGVKGACDPSLAQTCVNAKCAYTFPATSP